MNADNLESVLRAWMAPGLSAAIALVVATLAYRAGVAVARRLTLHRPVAAVVVKRAEGHGLAVAALLAVQAVLQSAPNGLPGVEAARHGAALLLIAGATWLAVRMSAAIADAVSVRYPLNVTDNLSARRI